jgi:hypothetical protein
MFLKECMGVLRRNRDKKLRKKYFEIWELNNKNVCKYRCIWIGVGVRRQGSWKRKGRGGRRLLNQ